jgi:hypothetical protein
VQVALYVLYEVAVELVVGVHHLRVHGCLFELVYQGEVLLALEQTGDLAGGQQGVHFLQEGRG